MGVTGSGKSTVGRLLAARLEVPFADADDFHSAESTGKMAAGLPLTDADRAPWLRRLADWLQDNQQGVLACSALKRRYRDVLRAATPKLFFLHLAGPATAAQDRVAHRIGHYMPASLVGSQYTDLEPLQPDERGLTVDFTAARNEIVHRFVNWLDEQP